MLKRNRIKCNEVWIVLCCDKLNYVFYSLIDEEYQFCNTACTYKFITAKLFTLTGFWNNFHLYVIKYSPDGKIFHIKFLAINEVYIFHSMHKLFAQWALRGKSVVSVNHIQCGQPLPNLTEMWSTVLEIKHKDQCAQNLCHMRAFYVSNAQTGFLFVV